MEIPESSSLGDLESESTPKPPEVYFSPSKYFVEGVGIVGASITENGDVNLIQENDSFSVTNIRYRDTRPICDGYIQFNGKRITIPQSTISEIIEDCLKFE